jgi:hypothetical protein
VVEREDVEKCSIQITENGMDMRNVQLYSQAVNIRLENPSDAHSWRSVQKFSSPVGRAPAVQERGRTTVAKRAQRCLQTRVADRRPDVDTGLRNREAEMPEDNREEDRNCHFGAWKAGMFAR